MSPCSGKNTKSREFPKGEPVCPGSQAMFIRSPAKRLLPLTGLIALVWFLVRVIPKPSRAAYPCQQAAAPIAAGFIIWLVSLAGSMLVLRKARRFFYESRYLLALSCLVVGVTVAGWSLFFMPTDRAAATTIPINAPNTPMGTARGIHPGRVVWVHDPNATSWNGTSGNYWDHTSQAVVDKMLSQTIRSLAGEGSDDAAWAAFFRYYNIVHGKGNVGYRAGEKIAIKINTSGPHVSKQMALALLCQLVNHARVPIDKITTYDIPCNTASDPFFDYCRKTFPTLRFVGFNGLSGHEPRKSDLTALMHWSWGTGRIRISGDDYANATHLPKCVTEADYLINLAQLKGHALAGVTLCGKNWFGSFCSYPDNSDAHASMPVGAGVHPYIAAHYFSDLNLPQRAMGTYNCLVDLMAHPQVGGKTMLYLLDGLYVTKTEIPLPDLSCRWQSAPFKNDWTSSIFASQDPVAIDSVAIDFILSEPVMTSSYGTVDNYLHEAAQADNPPSRTFYDPEGTKTRPRSLGVHEHWNNSGKKLYSRNLHTGNGIELVGFSPGGNILPASAIEAKDWGRYD